MSPLDLSYYIICSNTYLGSKKFAKVTSEPNKPVKDYISGKLVIRSLFSRDVTFYVLLEL